VRAAKLLRAWALRQPLRPAAARQDSFPAYVPPVVKAARRKTPGFRRQLVWCFARAVLQSTRQTLSTFLSYAIFATTGEGRSGEQSRWSLHLSWEVGKACSEPFTNQI
jgi:hypothetical protein